jgi:hypothetical protein
MKMHDNAHTTIIQLYGGIIKIPPPKTFTLLEFDALYKTCVIIVKICGFGDDFYF